MKYRLIFFVISFIWFNLDLVNNGLKNGQRVLVNFVNYLILFVNFVKYLILLPYFLVIMLIEEFSSALWDRLFCSFTSLLNGMLVFFCSSFGRELRLKCRWAGSKLYVQTHINEPPCIYECHFLTSYLKFCDCSCFATWIPMKLFVLFLYFFLIIYYLYSFMVQNKPKGRVAKRSIVCKETYILIV